MPPQPKRSIDDPLLARLDQLARRRETQRKPAASTKPGTAAATSKRRHPARGARIGALVVSCASTGGLTYLFASGNGTNPGSPALAALPAPVAISPASGRAASVPVVSDPVVTPAPNATVGVAGPTVPAAAGAPATAPAGSTQPVAFNGEVVNTRYGPVQVQVQIANGSLSEVAVVQYPDGDGRSRRINARALPTLHTEALAAQSANVDTVSGATYTSDGYARSLQSALDAARSAGITVA